MGFLTRFRGTLFLCLCFSAPFLLRAAGLGPVAALLLTLLVVFATFELDSRILVGLGLSALALTPILWIIGGEGWGDRIAISAYAFLSLGVLAQGIELVLQARKLRRIDHGVGLGAGGQSLFSFSLAAVTAVMAVLAVEGYLLAFLGSMGRVWLTALLLWLGLFVLMGALRGVWAERLSFQVDGARLIGGAFVGLAILIFAVTSAWPSLLPISTSPSIVDYYSMMQAEGQTLTLELAPSWPAATMAALVGQLIGVDPLLLLHFLASVLAALVGVFLFATGERLLRGVPFGQALSVLAGIAPLGFSHLFLAQFAERFELAELFAGLFTVMAWYWALRGGRERSLESWLMTVVALLGLLLVYPAWAPASILSAALLARWERAGLGAATVILALPSGAQAVLLWATAGLPLYPLLYASLLAGAALLGGVLSQVALALPRRASFGISWASAGFGVILVAGLGSPWQFRPFDEPIITPQALEVALWAKAEGLADNAALVAERHITARWLAAAIGRTGEKDRGQNGLGWVTPTDWQEGPAQPALAIVADMARFPDSSQVAVVFEMGASAVVQKLTPESGPIPLIMPEPPIAEVPAQSRALVALGNELLFLGSDLSSTSVRPGNLLVFSLYWQALRPPPRNYQVSVHLVDEEGRSWALDDGELMDRQRVGEVQWGQVLYYTHALTVPDGTPVGRYRLVVTVYPIGRRGPLEMPLAAFDRIAGRPGPIALGPIKVGPKQPLVAEQLSPQHSVRLTLGDEIAFLGYDRSGGIRGGQPLTLVLYWQALQRPKEDYTVFVHILDDKGAVVLQQDQYPVGNRYPTSLWEAGEAVADTYVFSLPQQIPAGRYAVEVGMYRLSTLERLPVSGAQGPVAENRIMLEPLVIE